MTFTPLVLTTETGLCPATIAEVVPLVSPVVADCKLSDSFLGVGEGVGRRFWWTACAVKPYDDSVRRRPPEVAELSLAVLDTTVDIDCVNSVISSAYSVGVDGKVPFIYPADARLPMVINT